MKNLYKILILSIVFGLFYCCEDDLNVDNRNAFDPGATWDDPQLANAYLTNLYADVMPNAWPTGSGATNAGLPADDRTGVMLVNTITEDNHPWAGQFNNQYVNIRNANILLAEIDAGTLDTEVRNAIVGQTLFFRAWSYFNLVRVYGGVPLLLEPQNIDDELNVPRASTLDVFNAILNDLDEAAGLLNGQTFVNDDKGRIGIASILAFKGRVALYMASPLFNSEAPYTNQYWAAALIATETAKTSLENLGFGLAGTYPNVWAISNEGHNEAVLTVKFDDSNRSNGRREHGVRPLEESSNAVGFDVPLWKHVESYTMADGYAPGSSPNYTYDLQTYWGNRDPRFYYNIIFNGAPFELSGKVGRRQYSAVEIEDDRDAFHAGSAFSANRTGFFTAKGVQIELGPSTVEQNEVDWIEIRFAEVLLNFAEAANEMGRTDDALDVLKQIRQRAGIEPGPTNDYGLDGLATVEEVRRAIQDERYIEFLFEGKRFWDLKRWRRLTELDGETETGLLATPKAGIDLTMVGPNDLLPEDFDYEVRPLFSSQPTNIVPDNYYFAPIPLGQLNRNSELEQNVGWGGTFDPEL